MKSLFASPLNNSFHCERSTGKRRKSLFSPANLKKSSNKPQRSSSFLNLSIASTSNSSEMSNKSLIQDVLN